MTKPPPSAPNRLSEIVHRPGGVRLEEAVRAADANLERIRGDVVREVEATLERMLAIGDSVQDGPDHRALEDLYALANTIPGMAGSFGMPHLGDVCYSLCSLIDRLNTARRWDGPALQVHMDSLRLLRPGTKETEARQKAVVGALQRVVGRV